jgi:hypothetical protein
MKITTFSIQTFSYSKKKYHTIYLVIQNETNMHGTSTIFSVSLCITTKDLQDQKTLGSGQS